MSPFPSTQEKGIPFLREDGKHLYKNWDRRERLVSPRLFDERQSNRILISSKKSLSPINGSKAQNRPVTEFEPKSIQEHTSSEDVAGMKALT